MGIFLSGVGEGGITFHYCNDHYCNSRYKSRKILGYYKNIAKQNAALSFF